VKSKYWEKFAKEDEEIESLTQDDYSRQRKKMENEWKRYREEARKDYAEEAPMRSSLRGGYSSDPEAEVEEIEEVYEEELSVVEEVIG